MNLTLKPAYNSCSSTKIDDLHNSFVGKKHVIAGTKHVIAGTKHVIAGTND